MLTARDVDRFADEGFLVVQGAVAPEVAAALRSLALADLEADRGPLEREVDVGYPGAPASLAEDGGRTVRRLLRAYDRGEAFRALVHDPRLGAALGLLLASDEVHFVQAHHNCVMTKQPRFSSDTGWHRDVRYWHFTDDRLVNAWVALTPENAANGALRIVPGSHRLALEEARFDASRFLRTDLPANERLLATAVQVVLAPGDVLFFHAAAFHFATRNRTRAPKLSAVFTFHGSGTRALPGSKSASLPEIPLRSLEACDG